MSRKIFGAILILTFILVPIFQTQSVFAKADSEVEVLDTYNPSLLPDSPFYFLKTWLEEIQEFITLNPTSKAELQLKLANKRLVEAQKLAEKGKTELAQKLLDKFRERIEKAAKKTEEAEDKGKNVDELVAKLQANSLRQQEVLLKVYEKVPEQARDSILQAMENSKKGLANAINNVQGIHKKEEFEKKVDDLIEGSNLPQKDKNKVKGNSKSNTAPVR